MKVVQNINNPALVFWGTKRGKKTFLAHGIEDNLEDINDYLYDIRNYLQFGSLNLEYFILEQKDDYIICTIAQTIFDWVGRNGYFSASLVIPYGKKIKNSEQIPSILQEIAKEYHKKYIQNSAIADTIDENAVEDKLNFIDYIKKYELENTTPKNLSFGSEKCAIQFDSIDDLSKFFKYYDREDIKKYERIVFIPKNKKDTTCSYPFIKLEDYQPKTSFQICVRDENDQPIVAKIYLSSNKSLSLGDSSTSSAGLSNPIKIEETLGSIEIMAAGYDNRIISKDEFTKQINGLYNVQLKRKPPTTYRPTVTPTPSNESNDQSKPFPEINQGTKKQKITIKINGVSNSITSIKINNGYENVTMNSVTYEVKNIGESIIIKIEGFEDCTFFIEENKTEYEITPTPKPKKQETTRSESPKTDSNNNNKPKDSANTIQQTIQNPFVIGGIIVVVLILIGIALIPSFPTEKGLVEVKKGNEILKDTLKNEKEKETENESDYPKTPEQVQAFIDGINFDGDKATRILKNARTNNLSETLVDKTKKFNELCVEVKRIKQRLKESSGEWKARDGLKEAYKNIKLNDSQNKQIELFLEVSGLLQGGKVSNITKVSNYYINNKATKDKKKDIADFLDKQLGIKNEGK